MCVWTEAVPTYIRDVGECDHLQVLPALVNLFVKLVVFWKMSFERAHDEDVVFSL